MGHRRVVLICHDFWRLPTPSLSINEFSRAMEAVGVRTSEFNLPHWDESREGLALLLDSLFRVTPPTALICIAPHSTAGVLGWLLAHGLRVPRDVSLVGYGMDADTSWVVPGLDVARIDSDVPSYWRRVREWVAGVAKGRVNRESVYFEFELVEGNSMGPPPTGGI